MTVLHNPACLWFERVWNRNDLDAIAEMTTPDLKAHGADGIVRSGAMFAEFQRAMRAAMPDLHVKVTHCVEGRDMVATHWVATGTHSGASDGLPPPSGRHIEITGLTLVRMEGSKIAEGWDDYDVAGLMKQLGVGV
jgi:steroid delta-isomerase-like uncharacterized protein